MATIRVGINGYGTIGRRVADAVLLQDDMVLVGVTKATPDFRMMEARDKGMKVFAASDPHAFEGTGYTVEGTVHDLLKKCDVVVDCAPKKLGKKNKELYGQYPNLRAVFQGGEEHSLTNFSFNSQCNYDQAKGRQYARVVSCNTTALCRVLSQLDRAYGIKKARVAIVRRSVDPGASNEKGPVNAWEPAPQYPSHHAIDVQTILPNIKVTSLAGIAPMTIMHGHMLFCELQHPPKSADEAAATLGKNPRIRLVSYKDGFFSTAQIKDYAEANGRHGNMYEVCVWKDAIGLDADGELGLHLAIDQQADVVPENIDAIRALMGTTSAEDSIRKTDASLGMG
jgi:glyceraldehyde-3-phosphate dehydrogenase (NAD(P))